MLIAFAALRQIHFHPTLSGVLWFTAVALLFAIGCTASRRPRSAGAEQRYIARVPAIAIVPWFLAGSLFAITALPLGLTWFARFLPLTHALALMRYGLLGDSSGLHAIWRMSNPTSMAASSLGVVAVFAALLTAVSIRVFKQAAVR